MNEYSTDTAKQKLAQGVRGGLGKAIGHGLWSFLKFYFMKLGFLDGKAGFMLAISSAEGSYYRYLKLMLLDKKNAA